MNKSLSGLIIIFAVVLCLFSSTVPAQEVKDENKNKSKLSKTSAIVLQFEGTVQGYHSDSRKWNNVKKKERFLGSDSLSTGQNSSATLKFHDDHTLQLKANTEMTIRQLHKSLKDGGETTEIDLKKGEILSRVRKLPTKGSIYTIHTPTATSSVRGTRFSVKVYEAEGKWVTEVKVLDGLVEVTDKLGKLLEIQNGREVEIGELGAIGTVGSIDGGTLEEMRSEMPALPGSEGGDDEGPADIDVDDIELQLRQTIENFEVEANEPPEVDQDDDDDRYLD